MSPTPIREALRMLQAQGLIENEPHKGMVVRSYSADEVAEIYRLRTVLEPFAVSLACQRASTEELKEIAQIQEKLQTSVDTNAPWTATATFDFAWHQAICASCKSRYLEEFITRLWSAIPLGFFWISSRAQKASAEHGDVTAALLARDNARAARLMKLHIRAGADSHQTRFDIASTSPRS
jgi:DNA-binding GntR family transcriptional regulator